MLLEIRYWRIFLGGSAVELNKKCLEIKRCHQRKWGGARRKDIIVCMVVVAIISVKLDGWKGFGVETAFANMASSGLIARMSVAEEVVPTVNTAYKG